MITIYGRPGCVNCEKAKLACYRAGITYEYKVIGSDVTQERMSQLLGGPVRSVPQIFRNEGDGFNEHIGGYEQLEKLIKEGL